MAGDTLDQRIMAQRYAEAGESLAQESNALRVAALVLEHINLGEISDSTSKIIIALREGGLLGKDEIAGSELTTSTAEQLHRMADSRQSAANDTAEIARYI